MNCKRTRCPWEIREALLTGYHEGSNVDLTLDGDARLIGTPEGPRWVINGVLTCRHYETRVLAVDFTRDMITDFGYTGYSMHTDRNIQGWMAALKGSPAIPVLTSLRPWVNPFRYTDVGMLRRDGRPKYSQLSKAVLELNKKFIAGVPWVKTIDSVRWFVGSLYDDGLVAHYSSTETVVMHDQNWRYMTASWIGGVWSTHYHSPKAAEANERRIRRRSKAVS